jgi:anti-anti-sigma factor
MKQIEHYFDSKNSKLLVTFNSNPTSSSHELLKEKIDQMFQHYHKHRLVWSHMVLDLKRCNMVDSTGLNLIIHLVKYTKSLGGKVQAWVTNRTIYRTFLFVRLEKQMLIDFIEPTKE